MSPLKCNYYFAMFTLLWIYLCICPLPILKFTLLKKCISEYISEEVEAVNRCCLECFSI